MPNEPNVLAKWVDLLATKQAEIGQLSRENAALTAEVERLRLAVEKVRANSYLDDNVINRHQFTTVGCEALRELFAALLAPPTPTEQEPHQ